MINNSGKILSVAEIFTEILLDPLDMVFCYLILLDQMNSLSSQEECKCCYFDNKCSKMEAETMSRSYEKIYLFLHIAQFEVVSISL